ncbi:MAG: hypothetical protein ACI8PZ_000101 [Myxococcota bacterium]|jgi:hypothetical protein
MSVDNARVVGGAVGAIVVGVLSLMWAFMPDIGDAPVVSPPAAVAVPSPRPQPAAVTDEPRRERRRVATVKRVAEPLPERSKRPDVAREPAIPDAEERALARREIRDDVASEIRGRLDGYALEAGWDPQTKREVEAVFELTSRRISDVLDRVDRGELEWSSVRREMRQFRLDSAREVQDLLGPDDFQAFTEAMDFQRFIGERPVRGRL